MPETMTAQEHVKATSMFCAPYIKITFSRLLTNVRLLKNYKKELKKNEFKEL